MGLLAGIKTKLIAGMTALVGILLFWLKLRGDKIEDLEHDALVNEKIKENQVKQVKDKKEVLDNEKDKINKKVKDNAGKSRRDRASKL